MPLRLSTCSPKQRDGDSVPNNSFYETARCETHTIAPDKSPAPFNGFRHLDISSVSRETLNSVESNVFKSHHSQDVLSRTSAGIDRLSAYRYSGDYMLTSHSYTEISKREFRLPGTRYLPPDDISENYNATALSHEHDCSRTIRSSPKHSKLFRNGSKFKHLSIKSAPNVRPIQKSLFTPVVSTPNLTLKHPRFIYRKEGNRTVSDLKAKPVAPLNKTNKQHRSRQQKGVVSNPSKQAKIKNSTGLTPPQKAHVLKPFYVRARSFSPSKLPSAGSTHPHPAHVRRNVPEVTTPSPDTVLATLVKSNNELTRLLPDSYKKIVIITGNELSTCNKMGLGLNSSDTKSPKLGWGFKLTDTKSPKLCSSLKLTDTKSPKLCSSLKLTDTKSPKLGTSLKLMDTKSPKLGTSLKLTDTKSPKLCSSLKLSDTKSPKLGSSLKLSDTKSPKLGSSLKLTDNKSPKLGSSLKLTDTKSPKLCSSLKLSDNKSPKLKIDVSRQHSLTTSEINCCRQLSTVMANNEHSNLSKCQLRSLNKPPTLSASMLKNQQGSQETVTDKRPDAKENSPPMQIKSKYRKFNCTKFGRKTSKTDSKKTESCKKLSPKWITAWQGGNDTSRTPVDVDVLEDSVWKYKPHPQLSGCALQVDLSNSLQSPVIQSAVHTRAERAQHLAELILPSGKESPAPLAVVKKRSFYTSDGSSQTKSVCSKGTKCSEETSVSSEWDTVLTTQPPPKPDPGILNTGAINKALGATNVAPRNDKPSGGKVQNFHETTKVGRFNTLRRASSLLYLPSHPKPRLRIPSKFKKPSCDSQITDVTLSSYATCRDYSLEKLVTPFTNGQYFHSPSKGFNSNTRRTVGIGHGLIDLLNSQPLEQDTGDSRKDAGTSTRIHTSLISGTASCPPCMRRLSPPKKQHHDPKLRHETYTPLLNLPRTPSNQKLVRDILKASSLPQQISFIGKWRWRSFLFTNCVIFIISLSFALVLTLVYTYTT